MYNLNQQHLLKHSFILSLIIIIGLTVTPKQTAYASEKTDANNLYTRYIEHEFLREIPVSKKANIRAKGLIELNPTESIIYEKLEQFISEVAAGTRTSTTFSMATDELKDEYRVISKNEDSDNTDKSEEMICMEIINNYHILAKLAAEHPYELYWFDKTGTLSGKNIWDSIYKKPSVGEIEGPDEKKSYCLFGNIVFKFPVVKEYKGEKNYTIDPSSGELVQKAVANAKKIVNSYKSLSDYNKLKNYCRTICKLTSPNTDSRTDVNNEESFEYGNPWQLIWVFDEDPSTKVVCEGYAKAFQYLCDLSTFKDKTKCYTATGFIKIKGKSQGHMWNVVNMKDRKNYLVDVINCDNEPKAEPDYELFLAGCKSSSTVKGTPEPITWYTYSYGAETISYCYDADSKIVHDDNDRIPSKSSYYNTYFASAIKITGLSHKIAAGKKIKLTAIVYPSTTLNKKVVWTSSNPKVATVNSSGLVAFKKKSGGKNVTITAKAADGSGVKKTYMIRSMKGIVKKIKIKKTSKKIKAGKSVKLKAKIKSTKGANKVLIWTSSNKSYATVNSKGLVKTKKAGKGKTVKITAKTTDGSGKSKTIKLKIK